MAADKKKHGLTLSGVYENRKLIGRLSANDFKTRFAGSYLGIIWAFVLKGNQTGTVPHAKEQFKQKAKKSKEEKRVS